MSSKVLLDTNVMLDLALARPEGFDAAATIAEAVAYEEVVAYVCATSLKDLYYILSKAMGEKDARTYIKAVMDDFIICSVDYALCRQAADSDEPDFEDGLVRACAENARVDFIVTRDVTAFARSKVRSIARQIMWRGFLSTNRHCGSREFRSTLFSDWEGRPRSPLWRLTRGASYCSFFSMM